MLPIGGPRRWWPTAAGRTGPGRRRRRSPARRAGSARFDLLTTLAWTGRYELRAGSLLLAGAHADDDTAVAAKRVFGIADPLLIDRRAATLAEACEVPLEALDLALFNWQRGEDARATLGAGAAARADTARSERAASALGVSE
jgi:hypothetical protein